MGRLWLSTNKGLAAFDRSTGTFRAFNAADGLQSTEFNNGAYAALRDGRLAFGGVDGLTLFSPQAIVASRYPAPVVFTDVIVGDANRPVLRGADNVRIAQADRIVHFEFAALDFTAPERNRFQYRLEGFDQDWIDAGSAPRSDVHESRSPALCLQCARHQPRRLLERGAGDARTCA